MSRRVQVLLVAPVLALAYDGFARLAGMNLGGQTWMLASLPVVLAYAFFATWCWDKETQDAATAAATQKGSPEDGS